MHILLTDLLSCPRCGPEFGLILRGDRIEDRRVHAGVLGCPNCREGYPIEEGFADLRSPPRPPLPPVVESPWAEEDEDEVLRIAALLGVKEGPGHLVLVGPSARAAPALARMLERIEVVAMAPDLRVWGEEAGVSRMVAGPGLPFFSRRIRGVLLDGEAGAPYLDEALRVVGPGSRLAVLRPNEAAADRIREAGLELVLDQEPEAMVAERTSR
ncbi:MAG: Trm112 family protein [Longimicrobiales bacterium]|nr:Trm112 family protein [Longimicrobiales bacterium]